MKRTPQTLSEDERRLLAAWAADCAEQVLHLFEAERPTDARPRAAIARTRAFADGMLNTAIEIRNRFGDGSAARDAETPVAAAAAMSAGQASAVCHMGAHALGAAAYAIKAKSVAAHGATEAAENEIRWQLCHMNLEVQSALRSLPPLGENRSGPLGAGLLARGFIGTTIEKLHQAIGGSHQAHCP